MIHQQSDVTVEHLYSWVIELAWQWRNSKEEAKVTKNAKKQNFEGSGWFHFWYTKTIEHVCLLEPNISDVSWILFAQWIETVPCCSISISISSSRVKLDDKASVNAWQYSILNEPQYNTIHAKYQSIVSRSWISGNMINSLN